MASNDGAESANLSDNTLRTYYAMSESMCKAHLRDDNKNAEDTARILLSNVDLPILIRARALMILGCSLAPDYLEMAEEAVRIVEVGIEQIKSQGREPGEVETTLLESCKKVYEQAMEDSKEEAGEGMGMSAAPEEGQQQAQVEAQESSLAAQPRTAPTDEFSTKTMDMIEHSEAAGFGGGQPYKNPSSKKNIEQGDEESSAAGTQTKNKEDDDVEME